MFCVVRYTTEAIVSQRSDNYYGLLLVLTPYASAKTEKIEKGILFGKRVSYRLH